MESSPYRFILYPVVTIVTLITIAASCQQSPQPLQSVTGNTSTSATGLSTACTRGKVSEVSEVVIGVIYPLSEPTMMTIGFGMQAATNIALADINEKGGIDGKPVRMIIYDSGTSPEQGALFAERLATIDCVAGIVGVFHSDVALAVKEVAKQYHIPVIFADPYADEVTSDHTPEVFRIAPTRTMLIQMMAQWLARVGDYNKDGKQLTVMVVENSRYGTMRSELVQQWLPAYGIDPVIFTVDLPTTDFSTLIARIVALEQLPDAVFLYLHNGDNFLLQQQLLTAGIGPKQSTLLVIPSSGLDDTTFWQQVPDGELTVVTQVGPWYSTVTPMGQRFADVYQQYFKRWPEATAFEAHDALWLMADAIQRAGTLAADDIIHALEKTDIELASGYYYFPYGSATRPDGQEIPDYMWHQWPDPQLLYLQYTVQGQSARAAPVIWPPIYQTVEGPLASKFITTSIQ